MEECIPGSGNSMYKIMETWKRDCMGTTWPWSSMCGGSQQCVEQCFSRVVLREVCIRGPGYAGQTLPNKDRGWQWKRIGRNTSHIKHAESSGPSERWSVGRGGGIREESR